MNLVGSDKSISRVFVFKEYNSKIVFGHIIEIIGDTKYLEKNVLSLQDNHQKREHPNFNGAIITYDPDYNYLSGKYFKNGKYQPNLIIRSGKNITNASDPTKGRITSTLRTQTEEGGCTLMIQVLTVYYNDGSQENFNIGSYCEPNSTGEGSGGGSGSTIVTVSQITNNLVTPCYTTVLNLLLYNNLRNEVQDILNEFSVSSSPYWALTIREESWSENDPHSAGYFPDIQTIILNNTALKYASQEYIAATYFHEILHAYLDGADEHVDHYYMATRYVEPMVIALRGIFPELSLSHAEALVWGGLQDYGNGFSSLPAYKQNLYNTLYAEYFNSDNARVWGTYCD